MAQPVEGISEQWASRVADCFATERRIFEVLEDHPRIIQCFGWQDGQPGLPSGLLLAEASHGSLQSYLDDQGAVPFAVRKKWCRQVVESVVYIHRQGVIHSDLRPTTSLSMVLLLLLRLLLLLPLSISTSVISAAQHVENSG
ncbi:uncharacterized protein F4812DRAFT_461940 [Daldinia caldariorum]|uniref:uncharacterized protein n=1 Tax=Daldinia caldariorum TaxID=326644 RepID=UPI0020089AAC|nr:uncharacterized protein F4812DRAFT_461940 [Daldinia caldariorum]KAI1465095.1 hypothetical protein F4812DRAFT_461940 [Daldinia caldariorum]